MYLSLSGTGEIGIFVTGKTRAVTGRIPEVGALTGVEAILGTEVEAGAPLNRIKGPPKLNLSDSRYQPITDNPKVCGRLADFWKRWEDLGGNSGIVQILKEVIRLEFSEVPTLSDVPIVMESYSGRPNSETGTLKDAVMRTCSKKKCWRKW